MCMHVHMWLCLHPKLVLPLRVSPARGPFAPEICTEMQVLDSLFVQICFMANYIIT